MKKIEVFVDNEGKPVHLAVKKEHNADIPGEEVYRTVCGGNQGDTKVVETVPQDLQVSCEDCEKQLEMWKEVNS